MVYIPTNIKFTIAILISLCWAIFSFWIAQGWISELSTHIGSFLSHLIIFGIAIIPGFMNAFLISSLLLDKRPENPENPDYPPISILIACFNERDLIYDTLDSIYHQNYPNWINIMVVDDGSIDNTQYILQHFQRSDCNIKVIHLPENKGKSHALNEGLKHITTDLFITLDADSYLYGDSLKNLVGRYLLKPESVAVAGTVLVRNSRENLPTKAQEWDYFHGIAAIKRVQSLYQGVMVAQGAYSLFRTQDIRSIGGWRDTVGEDIVQTWDLLGQGYRIDYAENAVAFTNAPNTWRKFFRQRQRWSRGLIEALKYNWRNLFKARKTTMFTWWNLLFPYIDLVYTLAFIPGLILALFGFYYIAGPLTLLVLPLALLVNYIMFYRSQTMFKEQGLRVRRNIFGFIFYSLLYGLVLQPACTIGYFKELFNRSKSWGTK